MTGLSTLTPEETYRIPKKTLTELASPAGVGYRRAQMLKVLPPMLGNGISPERCFEILRPMFSAEPPDHVPDSEIWQLIRSGEAKGYRPSGFGADAPPKSSDQALVMDRPLKITPGESHQARQQREKLERVKLCEARVAGFRCTEEELMARSKPFSLNTTYGPICQSDAFLFCLHEADESRLINIVTDFRLEGGKANPVGPGETRSIYQWRRDIERHGVPQGDAGAWVRHNEVYPANLGDRNDGPWLGSGWNGAYTDQDIRQVRSVLVESDDLPRELQLAFLARAALPIVAITDSAGRSYQALVKVSSAEEGKRLLTALRRYGWDTQNHNASRLSRLPGALRKIRARDPENGTLQKLVYINPSPDGRAIL